MRFRLAKVAAVVATSWFMVACSGGEDSASIATSPTTVTANSGRDSSGVTDVTTTMVAVTSTTVSAADLEAIGLTRGVFDDLLPDEPGCSVAVSRYGEIVFAEAYGVAQLAPAVPMTTTTVVDIGSTSKQFTATAIALLAERDLVDLDTAVSTYVSDLPAWSVDVTVRQLLHHTTGIPDYIDLLIASGMPTTEPSTAADARRILSEVTELNFVPGDQVQYSNSNYFLLGQIVKEVTGNDLGAFLATEVFEPSGMAAVVDPTTSIPDRATSYVISGYTRNGPTWETADSPWDMAGPGGVQTTPSELVRWASQYWAPTIGEPNINTVRLDKAVEIPTGDHYGFGIIDGVAEFPTWSKYADMNGVRLLSHTGGWGGFLTDFVVAPDDHTAAAVTCTSPDVVPTVGAGSLGIEILSYWL